MPDVEIGSKPAHNWLIIIPARDRLATAHLSVFDRRKSRKHRANCLDRDQGNSIQVIVLLA